MSDTTPKKWRGNDGMIGCGGEEGASASSSGMSDGLNWTSIYFDILMIGHRPYRVRILQIIGIFTSVSPEISQF
jgi:hypothetical protein